jgi:hypothetical protein
VGYRFVPAKNGPSPEDASSDETGSEGASSEGAQSPNGVTGPGEVAVPVDLTGSSDLGPALR